MTSGRPVDGDAFREALTPLVDDLRTLANAVDDVGPRHGNVADAESAAMRELADEKRYAVASGYTTAITDTHMLGGATLRATADYVRTFGEVFTAERPPMYGHLVVARAALESAVIARWLNEPGIARDERVKRGLSEQLYSALEEERLDLDPNAGAHVMEWKDRAARLGWTIADHSGRQWNARSRGKPSVDRVGRPPIATSIAELLVDDTTAQIGKVQWSRLSSVIHVTWWGLRAALDTEDAAPPLDPDMRTVSIGTNSRSVGLQGLCILRALRKAASHRMALMGWEDDEWRTQSAHAERNEAAMLAAIDAGNNEVEYQPADRRA